MSFFTVLFQMLALLIMIGAGWLAAVRHMLDEHTNNQISSMIVSILTPLLVLSSAADAVGTISLRLLGFVGIIAVVMFLFFIVVGKLLSPLFDREKSQQKIYQLMFVFSNLSFIGIPVISSILGAEYVVYVMVFMQVYNLFLYTYGIAVMDGQLSAASLKGMLNPGTLFSIAGLLLIIANIRLPDFLLTAVSYLGSAAPPLALMSVGYTLANSDLKKAFGNIRLYIFSAIKLLALPLLMIQLLKLLPVDTPVLLVCAVMFGMPVGNMPLMLGTQKGLDCSTCTAAILVTTVLCVVTIPILLLVLPMI